MAGSTGSNNNKTLALAVSAIKTLKEHPGSTSREILNYITRTYAVDEDAISKQVHASLKRGLAYGILRVDGTRYSIPIESNSAGEEIASQEIGLMEMCRRKRGRRRRVQKRSSKGNSASGKRCCGKHCPCSGSAVQKRIKRMRKSGDQYLRTADSCCCINHKSRRIQRELKKSIDKRDVSENKGNFFNGNPRRRSSRLKFARNSKESGLTESLTSIY